MKKICFFIYDLSNSGGTERITCIAANGLVEKGYKVSIVSIKKLGNEYFTINEKVNLVSLSEKNKLSKISTIKKLREHLVREEIDVLITVDSILCVYSIPAVFFLKCKSICWEHFNYKINLGVKFRNIGRILAMCFCHKIVVLSQKDITFWSDSLFYKNKDKLEVIYNPSTYPITSNEYDSNSRIILSIGRLTYQKGFDRLLKAWQSIDCKNGWKLQIVGNGPEEDNLKKLIIDYNLCEYVEIIPPTPNVSELYLKSSIFCLPSRFEGFVLVLLEAQAFGLPVVAFDCDCGPSEVLTANNGYLIEQDNIQELSEKILSLMQDENLRVIMSDNAKNNAQKFTVHAFISNWVEILGQLK